MANLVTKSYFKADIDLPKGAYDVLDTFITKFERECLIYLLGYEGYALLKESRIVVVPIEGEEPLPVSPYKALVEGAEYEINGHTIKWNGLVNVEEESLIAYYVYCEYMRNRVTSTQNLGETKAVGENSSPANIFAKLFNSWNRFEELYGYKGQSELTPSAYNYLVAHQTDFPEWVFTELYGGINSHDL